MNKCIDFGEFTGPLSGDEKLAGHISKIIQALLEAQSPG